MTTPSTLTAAARERARELLRSIQFASSWQLEKLRDRLTEHLTREATEREALEAELQARREKPTVTLETGRDEGPVTCSACGHVGELKVNVTDALLRWLNAEIKTAAEKVDAEWKDRVDTASRRLDELGAVLDDAQNAIAEKRALEARCERLRAALVTIATSGCEGDDEHANCGDMCVGHEPCDCFPHQASRALAKESTP